MLYDIGIIGGGASGLAAGISAAASGASVLLVERMDMLGRKIPATGNGRCNLTNLRVKKNADMRKFYRGKDAAFAERVLSQFDSEDTIRFFASLGLYTHDRDGYVYPLSDQASTVRETLERALRAGSNVTVVTGAAVEQAQYRRADGCFELRAAGRQYRTSRLIAAAGGKSQSRLGSDGSGYALCKTFGHKIIPTVPALCALKAQDRGKFFRDCAGVRCRADVAVFRDGQFMSHDNGELQITRYGLSGIPVFQVSRYAAFALRDGCKVTARVDFVPEQKQKELQQFLADEGRRHPDHTVSDILCGILNSHLAQTLCRMAGISPETAVSAAGQEKMQTLIRLLKKAEFIITGTNDFDQSQVTAGGVSTKEIDSRTMMSRLVPGLYITGELLDIDGICGGFNLQWAWATGVIAGCHAAGGADD